MLVVLTSSLEGLSVSHKAGDVVRCSDEDGARLLEAGAARMPLEGEASKEKADKAKDLHGSVSPAVAKAAPVPGDTDGDGDVDEHDGKPATRRRKTKE